MKQPLHQLSTGIICLMLLLTVKISAAQNNEWNTWTGIEINKKINKKLDLFLSPEIRFDGQFVVDEYFIETGFEYELLNFLELGGNYRFLINERETKSTEYFNRIAVDLKGKHELNRFDLQLRLRYTNYSELNDADSSNDKYMRYRFKADYDIRQSKLTPSAGIEFFHDLGEKEINKIRYILGAEYKISKHHKIGMDYLLQAYLNENYHKNIFALQYQFDF